jgi:hypothetical protein
VHHSSWLSVLRRQLYLLAVAERRRAKKPSTPE